MTPGRFSLAVLALVGLTGAARAEKRSPLSIDFFARGASPLSPGNFSDGHNPGSAFGARLNREIGDRWTVGGQFASYRFSAKTGADDTVTLQPFAVIAQRRFLDSRTWVPFLNATAGLSRNSRDRLSLKTIDTGWTAGLGAGLRWNFTDLAALSAEIGVRHFTRATASGGALRTADAGVVFSFYLPESWVPLVPKEELSLEDLESPLDDGVGVVDEVLQTQGELNRVLQKIEDNQLPPIVFEVGAAIMQTGSYEALDNIGAVLRRHPGIHVRIYGFVEEAFVGGPVRAETLAQSRAETVRAYLLQNFRIPESTLVSAGLPPLPAALSGDQPEAIARHVSFEVVP